MIKTYVRVELGSESESPKQIVERMRKIGAVPIVGDFDFEVRITEDQRLFDKLDEIHEALKGSHVLYTLTTLSDAEAAGKYSLVAHYVDQKPLELRKALYKAKLERWRMMGLDVSELQMLLETDVEKFKEASKDFLRTHLDHMSVVKDARSQDNVVDGQVLALLDESGKTLSDIISITGFSEEEVMLSMGRLISAGSAMRIIKESTELYCLVPPPAPAVRKTVMPVPANDEAEARNRAWEAIVAEGSTDKEILRVSRLPREQLKQALDAFVSQGTVKIVRKGKRDVYIKT